MASILDTEDVFEQRTTGALIDQMIDRVKTIYHDADMEAIKWSAQASSLAITSGVEKKIPQTYSEQLKIIERYQLTNNYLRADNHSLQSTIQKLQQELVTCETLMGWFVSEIMENIHNLDPDKLKGLTCVMESHGLKNNTIKSVMEWADLFKNK